MNYISSAVFKQTHSGAVAKQVTAALPRLDEENRRVTFVVSTEDPDRDNDIIIQAGIDLSDFKKNPVILWGHDSNEPPIGKCIEIGIIDGKMTATFELAPPIEGCRSETVYQLLKGGFLFATSIGFLPIEWESLDDDSTGYRFDKVSLLEISVVSIPANPQALIIPSTDPEKTISNINTKTSDAMMHRKRIFEVIKRRV